MESLIAKTWLAAARAGYVNTRDWQRWADRIIEALPTPPTWIIDMSMAGDAERLAAIFMHEFYSEWLASKGCSLDELKLGFTWLRYKRGELSLASFLRVAGGIADGGDTKMGCECFYELLNQLERGQPTEPIEAEAIELLGEVVRGTKDRWRQAQEFVPMQA